MADLVSPIVDIISRLWTCCAMHTRYLCKLQQNMILLRNAMTELKDARNDMLRRVIEAEADLNEPKMRTDSVSGWLQSVEKIEGEVDVILQKADDEQLRRARSCLGVCCPPNNCWSSYKVGNSIAKKIPFVNDLKGKGHFEELTYRLPPPSVQDMNLETTVGMESMFDKVWRRLLVTNTDDDDDDKPPVRIMGLYGHGGVGKTTLLKKINNEFSKISRGHDDVVIFVVVSTPINYEAIQKKIGEKLGWPKPLQEDGDESSRADRIFNQLRKKKFVILLDDIWERVDLQRIGIPQGNSSSSSSSSSSSKIIFTTRNKQVCGLMEATHKFQVECLPWDKAWSLFQDKVGEEALTCFQGARELAKVVAEECGGLPLALITIGRAMSNIKSVEEWKDAITTLRNSASEFPGMGDEVLPRLKLSYDNLSNETMKSCFLYCALHPEDCDISMSGIIDYWIGEGFLNGNLDEARSHGHRVIETLKRACLLENGLEDIFSGKTYVKMHDIIRDLALWIVNDCKSSGKTTAKYLVASNNVCERWRNAERIYWKNNDGSNNELEEAPTSPNLRTLLVLDQNFSLPQSFFQFMPFLRVLDMSGTKLTEVPTSICQLSHLQYLGLSRTGIKELPIELRKLVRLKFLDLSLARKLEKIPAGVMANLSELQVLKLYDSGFKNWGLKEEEDGTGLSLGELDRLKQLQEVTLNISTSLALEELLCNQKLRRICTSLCLWDCINIKSISLLPPSSTSKGLGNLINLKKLNIGFCVELEELLLFINDEGETSTSTTTTAAGLPISNKLERLVLRHLPRLNNIVWGKYHHYMAAAQQQQQHYLHYVSSFQNLYHINILNCEALKDLTWLVYVENLRKLFVRGCEGLVTIIELDDDDLKGTARGVFGRLEILEMRDLPKLKSICRHALALPSIKMIIVFYGCPELKKLPLDSDSNVNNTLEQIYGSTKWWNELQWEDETIKSKFLPYFNQVPDDDDVEDSAGDDDVDDSAA